MVTVTTLRPFYDLQCRVDRNVGDVFDTSEGRAEQIDSALPGYITYKRTRHVHEVEQEPAEPVPDFSKMTVAQLKAYAAEKGIDIPNGTKKAEIIAILKG